MYFLVRIVLALGKSLPSGSYCVAKYHMMAPDSNIGRSPAEWSTSAGILHDTW